MRRCGAEGDAPPTSSGWRKTYFTKENRAVAIWTRKGGAAPEDPALARLPAEAKPMVKQMLEPDRRRQRSRRSSSRCSCAIDQMGGQAPPEMKPASICVRSQGSDAR